MSQQPTLARSREELAACLPASREVPVALVPTMGALHAGHASLFRLARDQAPTGKVVATIFVNPLQFGPGEDLARYPRSLDADLDLCRDAGVDVVFAPGPEDVYPDGAPQVLVDPGPLGAVLEGEHRPGHFAGVLTVVAKLFGLVRPDVAVFGEKDYQQLVLVRRMARDLELGVRVVAAPTHREADGLAMSSRNRYLDAGQRAAALVLHRALAAAQQAVGVPGQPAGAAALAAAEAELAASPDVVVDYLALVDPDLAPVPADAPAGTAARLLVAATLGHTRLLDNTALVLRGER